MALQGDYEAHHGSLAKNGLKQDRPFCWGLKTWPFFGGTGRVEIPVFFETPRVPRVTEVFSNPTFHGFVSRTRAGNPWKTSGVNDSSCSGLDVLEKPFFRGSSDFWSCFAGNATISYPTKNAIKKESLSIVSSNNLGAWKSKIYLCSKPPKQGPGSKRKGHEGFLTTRSGSKWFLFSPVYPYLEKIYRLSHFVSMFLFPTPTRYKYSILPTVFLPSIF